MQDTVLIVEDDVMQQTLLRQLLNKRMGFGAHIVNNGQEAIDYLKGANHDAIKLIIMDVNMPVMNGMEALSYIKGTMHLSIPVIILTGNDRIEEAMHAIRLGAVDFISKPYNVEKMIVTIRNTMALGHLSREVSRLQDVTINKYKFNHLVGYDDGLKPAVTIGRRAAVSNISILISGETGTGKELFSRAIHFESSRANKPFITVNCGAIPENLVESLLFGHEKGAFTGATEQTKGKFREADGGTLFLDEIGELPLDVQVKLLRVLQQKVVEPVGSAKTYPIDVRIISATNRDLKREVTLENFREDLYFRLNVLEINLPPLRERKEDIPMLTRYFAKRFCRAESLPMVEISKSFDTEMMRHDWSGNIRELENRVNKAIVLGDNHILTATDEVKSVIAPSANALDISHDVEDELRLYNGNILKTLGQIEIEVMAHALKYNNNNVTQAAKSLGIAKSTFYRKMSKRAP